MNHDFHTCPHCTMTYAATKTCWGCMAGRACESPERCETPNLHTCPEPYDPVTAQMLANAVNVPHAAPISMAMKGRIVLGLKAAHN